MELMKVGCSWICTKSICHNERESSVAAITINLECPVTFSVFAYSGNQAPHQAFVLISIKIFSSSHVKCAFYSLTQPRYDPKTQLLSPDFGLCMWSDTLIESLRQSWNVLQTVGLYPLSR